jgi:hypothetical protein
MKKFTHVFCLNDVFIDSNDGTKEVIFKSGHTYKIVGYDIYSLVYYIENDEFLDEFAITALNKNFRFLILEKQKGDTL